MRMAMKKGILISIEGLDGCGKSTLIDGLKKNLVNDDRKIIYTREPGGCDIAEQIRTIISSRESENMKELSELLLIYAGRNEHIDKVIKPAMNAGHIVITDRYVDSSYAFQVGGQKINPVILETLDSWVVKQVQPDLTIFLKLSIEDCLKRIKLRAEKDRYDEKNVQFFMDVQKEFENRSRKYPERILTINAKKSERDVLEEAISKINNKVKQCFMPG